MFHACFMTIPTCFVHTLCHYYAFSGTNLLTRCRSASSCFLLFLVSDILVRKYSRNWTKSTPSILESHEASRTPESRQRRALWAPDDRLARPGVGRAPLLCRRLVSPPTPPLRLFKPPRPKTSRRKSHGTRNLPEPPPSRSQDLGDRSLCSGTPPGRGSAPGRLLHRHRCHLHRHLHHRCCSHEEGVVLHRGSGLYR